MSAIHEGLCLRNYSLSIGENVLLNTTNACFRLGKITTLLGPSGAGKSTLLSGLSGAFKTPAISETGHVTFQGVEAGLGWRTEHVVRVPQKARLYTGTVMENLTEGVSAFADSTSAEDRQKVQQLLTELGIEKILAPVLQDEAMNQSMGIHKLVLMVRAIAKAPAVLILDEVFSDTSLVDEKMLLEFVKSLTGRVTVITITHNKLDAQFYSDDIALLSGGRLHEVTPCEHFFQQPRTPAGCAFLESGSAWIADEAQEEAALKPEPGYLKAKNVRLFTFSNEFYWTVPNRLGGMQKPGMYTDLKDDLQQLSELGVTHLVSLTEQPLQAGSYLKQHGITLIHFPITDMDVPDFQKTRAFLTTNIVPKLREGAVVVYHCKAGLGRTGLMLAATLVADEGISAISAIDRVRAVNHRYIQTTGQLNFVEEFDEKMKSHSSSV